MPLGKRFDKELVPEWRKQCLDYKTLKRKAENLVGREEGDVQEWESEELRSSFVAEFDKVSTLYNKQERKLCRFFCSLEAKIDSFFERQEQAEEDVSGDAPDCRHSHSERSNRRPVDAATLFESDCKDKQIPVAIMAFMVHIDALRSFALLNTLAVLKIANQHCSKPVGRCVLRRLRAEPFFNCHRLTRLVEELDDLAKRFLWSVFDASSDSQSESSDDTCSVWSQDGSQGRHPLERIPSEDNLSAYCTWKNQNGKLPAWVCQTAEKNTWGNDVRTITVKSVLQRFSDKLGNKLMEKGLEHIMPGLVQQFQVNKAQKQAAPARTAKQPTTAQAKGQAKAEAQAPEQAPRGTQNGPSQSGNQIPAGPAGPQDRGKNAHQHVTSNSEGSRPPTSRAGASHNQKPQTGGGLKVSRSCWNLNALAMGSNGEWDERQRRAASGGSQSHEELRTHVNSPPNGAMSEGSSERMESWPCGGEDEKQTTLQHGFGNDARHMGSFQSQKNLHFAIASKRFNI